MQRMDSSRMVKRILEWKPVGSRMTARPRIRWLDDVCKDIKAMNVENWKELAPNMKARNDLVAKDRTHKGL
jgi:virulence-associated protein VapD